MLFNAADIFVSASLMETYGLTLVEAMACGIPVVSVSRRRNSRSCSGWEGRDLCALARRSCIQRRDSETAPNRSASKRLGNSARKLVAQLANAKSRFAAAFARVYRGVRLYPGQTRQR